MRMFTSETHLRIYIIALSVVGVLLCSTNNREREWSLHLYPFTSLE
jgi:hypothetical protein